ncbi:MAG: hypothetical protein JXA97_01295 [Anaerolineales bacterium]|nr:hypothetical protein [Anaerolineales bacterium]
MASKPISVEIYTTTHRVLGRIMPGARGCFSFINIPTQSYIEVEGAHLMRLHQPGKLVARHSSLWLIKSEITAILLSNRGEIGPSITTRGGYSTMVPNWVRVLMGGYELRGVVESHGKFNFGSLMVEGDHLFTPMYNAELRAILFPAVRANSPAMLINRKQVDAMALLPKEEIPDSGPNPAA